MCTYKRKSIFGDITNGAIHLNEIGRSADAYWKKVLAHFKNIEIDARVVMPNHVHAIISLVETKNEMTSGKRKRIGLGQVIAYYKYQTTKRINSARNKSVVPMWQRSFYDHIIRDENDLMACREYILENPLKWELDEYFG